MSEGSEIMGNDDAWIGEATHEEEAEAEPDSAMDERPEADPVVDADTNDQGAGEALGDSGDPFLAVPCLGAGVCRLRHC